MNTIRITPAQIISVAAQFDKASKYIQYMNDNLVNQLLSLEFVWDGITKQQFYNDFNIARKGMEQFVSLTSSISFELFHIAHKFMLADSELLNPPPYVDSRNGWEKSLDSLKEMGSDILEASDERYANQFSSVGGFLDYWTAGIPKAFYQGLVERSVSAFDTPNDFADYMTL